ncbi:MAG: DUF2225 domain-containing protein [Candidatus Muirbacterium halophilum]|nr:DUF2225 domain-containing protein [Candidatus Muirbacterium halophilum]MCK9476824.1 DUF2225 domain-containing protein [Candidatus Muirbacterium halophilum]
MTSIPATFLKETVCPVCNLQFKVEAVRTSKIRVLETYDDFGRKYSSDVNPILYSSWTCPKCLYSANSGDNYALPVIPELKVFILKHYKTLKRMSGDFDFYEPRTPEMAIKSLILSSLCYRIKRNSRGIMAACYMRVCWIMRNEQRDIKEELPFLKKAYNCYVHALTKEYSPNFGKISEYGIYYIIGLLAYKLGNLEKAKDYLSKVIMNKKKVETFILNSASILYDDLKNLKTIPKDDIELDLDLEIDEAEWIKDLDLTLD